MAAGTGMQGYGRMLRKDLARNRYVYLMAVVGIAFYALFHYLPMYGALIAFKHFQPSKGVLGSPWVGLDNFRKFFASFYFVRIFRNTLLISLLDILFGFPAPIILALLLNEIRCRAFRRTVQTIVYLPHFVSMVVICGLLLAFSAENGLLNSIFHPFGGARSNLMLRPELFRPIFVGSNVWQQVGWGSIIYLAALASVDPEMYAAAVIDGANRWQQTWHVTLPGILPTVVIMFILRVGNMMNVGFEKIVLLYNPAIYETSDVIQSFVYRRGILEADYSYSAAVGLLNSAINLALLVFANRASRSLTESSLW